MREALLGGSAVTGLALTIAMLAAYGIGLRIGEWRTRTSRPQLDGRLSMVVLSTVGILLAFNLSTAVGKFDEKRLTVVAEANTIGDLFSTVSMLDGPLRDELRNAVREYAVYRMGVASRDLHDDELNREVARAHAMHAQLQDLVGKAVAERPPIVVSLVMTFNALTSAYAGRIDAMRDRLPRNVVIVFFFASVLSMLLIGIEQGAGGSRNMAALVGFIVLCALIVDVTLDLNQPYRGAIRVSQEPLRRLVAGLAAE